MQNISYYYPSHSIKIVKGSKLASIVEKESWMVNSMHRQHIKTCPDGFIVNAISSDQIIEGMESVDPDWYCIAFQYHPEAMIFDECAVKIMVSFVEAAEAYAEKKK